jgi:WD40 repeat protein
MLAIRCLSALLTIGLAVGPATAQIKARVDHRGDPLPAGALYRIGTNRLQLTGRLHALAASPNGKLIAGFSLGHLSVWEAIGGREIVSVVLDVLDGPPRWFTPDGKSLGFLKYDSFALLDLASGKMRAIPVGGSLYQAACAPDGKTVITLHMALPLDVNKRTVSRWDVASGKLLKQRLLPQDKLAVGGEWLSPDGATLAAVKGDAKLREILYLCDAATGEVHHEWPASQSSVYSLVFSADSGLLAVGTEEGLVRVLESASGKEKGRCEVGSKVALLAFAPDSNSLFCGKDGSMTRWDWRTGKKLNEYPDASGALAFLAGGKTLAVVNGRYEVRLRETDTGKELGSAPRAIGNVAFSPDARFAAWTEQEFLVLADASTGKELRRWPANAYPEGPLAFSPDVKTLATGTSERIHLWDVSTGRAIGVIEAGATDFLQIARDGRRLATGNGAVCNLWDVASGKRLGSWSGRDALVAPGIKVVATTDGNAGVIRLLAPMADKPLHVLAGVRERVGFEFAGRKGGGATYCNGPFSPLFSPDGRLLLAGGDIDGVENDLDGAVYVWNVATGKRLPPVLSGKALILRNLAFCPDAGLLAVMRSDRTICLLSTATGKEVRQLGSGDDQMSAPPAFTPDGRMLVTAVNELVQVWEVATGGQIARREGHRGMVQQIVVSADSKRVATVSADRTILVWDLARMITDDKPSPAAPEAHWTDLANADAQRGRRAIESLIASPAQAARLLRERVKPVAAPNAKQMARWIADLDAADFDQRQRAEQALEKLADLAGPALRQTAAGNPSLEARRRIEGLLQRLDSTLTAEALRAIRSVQVLESIGNPESRQLLAQLADGAAGARLTTEAAAALARLNER